MPVCATPHNARWKRWPHRLGDRQKINLSKDLWQTHNAGETLGTQLGFDG